MSVARPVFLGLTLSLLLSSRAFPISPPVDEARGGTLQGFVRDASTGEALAYAQVWIPGLQRGDVTDEHGYYVITNVFAGEHRVRVSFVGFEPGDSLISVPEGRAVRVDFELRPSPVRMPEVVRTAERERFAREVLPAAIRLDAKALSSVPSPLEPDLFRSLQLLPGVAFRTDFSSALYVRGGNPSENLVLLDGVRIYNPYHVGGLFSTFNPDAVKSVDFHAGSFSPRYGNAVSSVIAVTTREGNAKRYSAQGNVSLLSSKLTLEGPVPGGSMLVSARRTYFDLMYNALGGASGEEMAGFPYYFYDLSGKVNLTLTRNVRLTVASYYGDDVLHFTTSSTEFDETGTPLGSREEWADVRLGNRALTVKLRSVPNPRLLVETLLAASRFRTRFETNVQELRDLVDAADLIEDHTFKLDATWFASGDHQVAFGAEAQRLAFELYFRVGDTELLVPRGLRSRRANLFALYLEDRWNANSLLALEAGLRMSYWTLGRFLRLDPRVALRYRALPDLNVKLAAGVFHQYFYTFNPEDLDYVRVVDLWFPIDERYKPIRAFHLTAGAEYWLGEGFQLLAESYLKYYPYVLDFNELGRTEEELDDFLTGVERAAGLEILLNKSTGRWKGWLAYTWAKAIRTVDVPRPSSFLREGKRETRSLSYPVNYDRRHTLNLLVRCDLGRYWRFHTRLTYATGQPETPTVGWRFYYELSGDDVVGEFRPVKAPKNSSRLPDYFRWDVSISRAMRWGKVELEPFLQIVNVTNHHNIFLYDYDLTPEWRFESGRVVFTDFRPKRQGVPMFPILPSVGIQFRF